MGAAPCSYSETIQNLPMKNALEIENIVLNIYAMRSAARIFNIGERAAITLNIRSHILTMKEMHCSTGTVITLIFKKPCGGAGICAAAWLSILYSHLHNSRKALLQII